MFQQGWKAVYLKAVVFTYSCWPSSGMWTFLTFLNWVLFNKAEEAAVGNAMKDASRRKSYAKLKDDLKEAERLCRVVLANPFTDQETREICERKLDLIQSNLVSIEQNNEMDMYQIHALLGRPKK